MEWKPYFPRPQYRPAAIARLSLDIGILKLEIPIGSVEAALVLLALAVLALSRVL